MRKVGLILSMLCLVAGVCLATTSNPAEILTASGSMASTSFTDFTALGENASGVSAGTTYRSSAGITAMIYSPIIPTPGDNTPVVPTTLGTVTCYPNPFNPATQQSNIAYRLATDADVKIVIFDVSGALIKTIITNSSNRASDGYSRYAWDGKDGFGSSLGNGVYIVKVLSGGRTIGSTKVMIVR